jgi:hypothetical protein
MYLKEETKRNIERIVGFPFEKIQTLTLEEEIAHVESRTGKKLQFPKDVDWRFIATGEPLITMGRCRTMKDVDKYFEKKFPIRSLLWKMKRFGRSVFTC